MQAMRFILITGMAVLLGLGPAGAADLNQAKNTVNNIKQADPPQVSTTTKPSPVGQPVSAYKPTGPSVHPKPVPSPVNKNNPRNDPQVQKGFDAHQQAHGR